MGVKKYVVNGRSYWLVDEWLTMPDGQVERFRKRKIPTKEQAMALVAKVKAEAFEGRFFERHKAPELTVLEAWEAYKPVSERDNDTHQTEVGRAAHLVRLLGPRKAATLTVKDVDEYRGKRLSEKTMRGAAPSAATLDREVELLKRFLNYAVTCGSLPSNPIARAKLLHRSNVRTSVLDEEKFKRLVAAADAELKPILVVAFDTGMRKREVLDLEWSYVDLERGVIRLPAEATKTDEARIIYLTARAKAALEETPVHKDCPYVFVNPATKKPWADMKRAFDRACVGAGLSGIWFHDLRRSFVTNARRRGVQESVVMRMSGHRTRAVFDRYNIVEEADLRAAVVQLEAAISRETTPALGQEMDKVG
ncbi:MAG: site-specific integrase [Myxococcota bacterium]